MAPSPAARGPSPGPATSPPSPRRVNAAPGVRRCAASVAAFLALTSTAATPALAQDAPVQGGYNADIELVRPIFSEDALPGIDVAAGARGGTVRWGMALGYTLNPLVLYEFDEEIGPVISSRISAFLGASVDISERFNARLSVPMMFQFGTQVPRYAADGFAFGDVMVGAHWAFFRSANVALGLRADVTLPTSRGAFYAGERLPRVIGGFIGSFDVGRVRIATDLTAHGRFDQVSTTEDLVFGTELVWNNGVRVTVLRERLALGATIYSRVGFTTPILASTSGEFLVNVQYGPAKIAKTYVTLVDVGVGRGFTRAYGSSDFRVLASIVFKRVPPVKADPDAFADPTDGKGPGGQGLDFNVRNIGQIKGSGDGDVIVEEPEWDEGELVRQEEDRIRIREELKFQVGTAELLPESKPTLDQMAALLNGDARVAHVVIEGHSSEDGEFSANFELSIDRAKAIWEALITRGVHPSRVSFRGMGEVMPAEASERYDELQASRRVVFHIVRQYQSWETPPDYRLDLKLPWNGTEYRAVQPRMPTEEEILGETLGTDQPARPRPGTADDEEPLGDVDFGSEAEEDDDLILPGGEPASPPPPPGSPPPGDDADETLDGTEEAP